MLSTRFGIAAIDAVHAGAFGQMVALRAGEIVRVPLAEATGELEAGRADDLYAGRRRCSSAMEVVTVPSRADDIFDISGRWPW